jgi:hypothetical protein
MFDEFGCGCIVSPFVGRVRICAGHRPEKATGDGAVLTMGKMPKVIRSYPANGMPVEEWTGR